MKSILDPLDTSFRGVADRLLESLGAGVDAHAGSVVRTLVEAYARELATFYAMLDRAHRSGFLDTATGGALDSVVALLGLDRGRAGRLRGKVELSRVSPTPRDIRVSAGFRVTGTLEDGTMLPLMETVEDVVMSAGSTRVTAEIQEVEAEPRDGGEAVPSIGPNLLTITPRPTLGIEAVTNIDPVTRSSADETDEHLRARAKVALRQSQRGTLESIRAAVLEQGIAQVEVREPPDGPPGVLEVLIGDPDFERDLVGRERVRRALRATKSAGVRARVLYLRTVFLRPAMTLKPADPLLDARGFQQLAARVRQALADFVAGIPSETAVSRRKLEAIVLATPGVGDVTVEALKCFTIAPDPNAPADPSRIVVRERPDTSELTGFIEVGASERASIDLERWPPVVAREREPMRQLDLVVSADSTDAKTHEAIRVELRGYAARFLELGDRGQRKLLEDLQSACGRALDELSGSREHETGGAAKVVFAMISDELGVAHVLDGSESLDHPALRGDAPLVLGGLEIVQLPDEEEQP